VKVGQPAPRPIAGAIDREGGLPHLQGMATITFDTLKFVHRLRDAGFPEGQAEAIAEAFKDASGEADLVTKTDLHTGLAELKFDLLKWVVGLALAQLGLLIGIFLKLL
jgi:hypothetical protein